MKKNYINPNCELLNFANVTMLHASAEMNNDESFTITFGNGGNYDGELFQ